MNSTVFTMETVPMKFGWGALEELPFDCENLAMKKVLLITDPNVSQQPFFTTVVSSLTDAGIDLSIFKNVVCEPTDASWQEAIDFAIANGPFDGFISLGGGSSMDTAKAVNLYASYPDDFMAYLNKPIGAGKAPPGPLKPHIACPTTAGTGSESTTVAIVGLKKLNIKAGISHKQLRCTLAVIDPQTTQSIPRGVVSSCALDVLTHALDSYTTLPYDQRPKPENPNMRPPFIGANPVSDMWSRRSIELVVQNIVPAYRDREDKEALSNLMLASTYAGLGFGNAGVHIPHAMGYPIAGQVKNYIPKGYPDNKVQVPHGVSVTLGAPAVFRLLAKTLPDRICECYAAMTGSSKKVSAEEATEGVVNKLIEIMQDLELPNGLSALGYTDDDIPDLVAGCLKQSRLLVNSTIVVDEAVLSELFKNSMTIW
ncbi:MAG: iron-containing alcohol dehydrogenase [Planctomycetes bacterium]|nr:iron-containing alcohol dehydrogenase [Planctomycetota bacterium]